VIASNVLRIFEEKKWSVTRLAEQLGVGRQIVYDYLGPRPGSAQRKFLWSDLAGLCLALDVTLFDLVLPPEGEKSGGTNWLASVAQEVGRNDLAAQLDPDDRTILSEVLFGITPKLGENFITTVKNLQRREQEKLRDMVTSMFDETAVEFEGEATGRAPEEER
jgi:DNA-binding Xre family transcriptional regulator